jgi:hypothetical protein
MTKIMAPFGAIAYTGNEGQHAPATHKGGTPTSLKQLLRRLPGAQRRPDDEAQRYDNVRIVSMADGSVIQGHDAVEAHFQREQELLDAYGPNIIFHVHRINLQAGAMDELVGEPLAEITVPGDFVAGDDTVAEVKARLRPLLEEQQKESAPAELALGEADQFTLFFNGRPMQDDKLFYAEHFMLLPAWVQVHLHACEFEEVMQLAAALRKQGQA